MKSLLASLSGACVLVCGCLLFSGFAPAIGAETDTECESPTQSTEEELPQPAGEGVAGTHIRPATERVEATPETIAEAMAQLERKANESLLLQTRFHHDIEQLDFFRHRTQFQQKRARCGNILRLDAETRLAFQANACLLETYHLAALLRALEQRMRFPKRAACRFR